MSASDVSMSAKCQTSDSKNGIPPLVNVSHTIYNNGIANELSERERNRTMYAESNSYEAILNNDGVFKLPGDRFMVVRER